MPYLLVLSFAAVYSADKDRGAVMDGRLADIGRGIASILTNAFYGAGIRPGGSLNLAQPLPASSVAVISNLQFSSISVSPSNVALGMAWSSHSGSGGTFDVYSKTNLSESLWSHLAEVDVSLPDESAVAEIPLAWLDNPPSAFFQLGTRLDTDGDGLPDSFELLAAGSSPHSPDTDRDGLGDIGEWACGASPSLRDSDDDGFVDGSDPDPLMDTPADDLDGDGIPDAFELFRFGATNAVDSLAGPTESGFTVEAAMLSGIDPCGAPQDFSALSATLASVQVLPAFLAEFPQPATNAVVWQRTIFIEPIYGLRQYFISGSPDGLSPPDLGGLSLQWETWDGGGLVLPGDGAFGIPTGFLYRCDLTLTLRRNGAAAALDKPLYLVAGVPQVTMSGTSVSTNGVTYYVSDFNATRTVEIAVDCSGLPRPDPTARSVMDGISSFFGQFGLAVGEPEFPEDPDASICILPLYVQRLGTIPLPSPVVAAHSRAGGGNSDYTSAILAIAPFIEWNGRHDASCHGDALRFDIETGTYTNICEYPVDSGCLWSAWHRGEDGAFECNCTAGVNLGTDDVPEGITTQIVRDDFGADGYVFLGGTEIWHDYSPHDINGISGASSGVAQLSAPEAGECDDVCNSCEGGNCDDLEDPSLGSLRFRIPLDAPLDGKVSGFVTLETDHASSPDKGIFNVVSRPGADITNVSRFGNGRMIRSNGPRGRQVVINSINGGVSLAITNLFEGAGGALDHTWEITRQGMDSLRLRKISRAGNLMRDETFVLLSDGATRIDNISGRAESFSREGGFTEDKESELIERRTVSDASGAVFEQTETVFRRFGEGRSAVMREVARRRMSPIATNACFATYWPDGRPQFSWGGDRPCRYTAFDDLGRETNSVSYFCDIDTLEDLGIYSGEGYSAIQSFPFNVFQTVTSYEPLTGDDAEPRDSGEPRRIDEYRTDADGEPVLAARSWFIHTRGLEQGWKTHITTTIRAASRNATMGDPANAVSVSTAIDADAPGIPRVLRGMPLSERYEDGRFTEYTYSQCSFSLANGAPCFAAGDTHWLCVATEEFGEEVKPVAHVSVIDASTGVEAYSAERHLASGLDFEWEAHLYDCRDRRVATFHADGSSSTNAFSCCRLLWTQDRDGAKTLRSATTGRDSLYYAMEEISLAQLPHDDNPGSQVLPYEVQGPSEANKAFRVTQRFMDAFGRETNTVVRTCRNPGIAMNENWTCAGWRASSSVAYPYGTSDYRVATDQRGAVTTTVRTATPDADIAQATASNKTTTVTSYRNGDGTTLEEWAGPTPQWRETRRFAEYSADSTRAEYVAVSSSDCDCVTNSATYYDFLGRAVRTVTPLSDIAYAYDGSTARVLSSFDTRSGLAVTNLFNELGEQTGQIQSGVETRTETGYEVVSNVLWRITTQTLSTPSLTNSSTLVRERLAPLSASLRSDTETYLDGILQSRSFSSFDTNTLVLTETIVSATSGTNTVKRKFGRLIETIDSTGRTRHFFDPYGRAFFKTLNNRRVDAYGRNDCGDIEEYAVFRAKVNWLSDLRTYDVFGNRIATTNALGDAAFYAYDAANRLVATGGATYPLLYGYDTQGRRTSLSTTRDANPSTLQPFNFSTCVWDETRWGFDSNTGLCTNKTYADGSTVSYTYAPDGKPLRTSYPSGRWKENAYDANRRLVSTEYSNGETDSFAYDVFGQRIAESNAVASSVYLRDNRGNCTNETVVLAGGPQSSAATVTNTIERTFDAYGRLTRHNLCGSASSREIAYAPDSRIAAISNAEAVVEYAYTSDRLDAGYTLTLPNGTTFTRTIVHDTYRRNLILAITNSVNGIPVETFSYAYDALGHPISRNADTFGYNARSEVVSATIVGGAPSPATATYAYDGIGNLLEHSCLSSTNAYTANNLNQYTSISHLRVSAPPCELSYDPDGNLLADGVFSYAYDADNRLASVASNGLTIATFAYDAQGRRVRKDTPSAIHTYTWDGWLLAKETATDLSTFQPFNFSTDYVWGKDLSGTLQGAGGVGGLLYEERDSDIYVPFYDNNGNITRYLDANGNTVAQYTYDAFGNIIAQSGPLADYFRHRFSTKYLDTETGLYYYGYRFYSPKLMRWLNRDPIAEQGGENLYAFCENNGVSKYDPRGNASFDFTEIGGDAKNFFTISSITIQYKKKWWKYSGFNSQNAFEILEVSPGANIDKERPGCARLQQIRYTIIPATGEQAFVTLGKADDPYRLWSGEVLKTSTTKRNRFRFYPVVSFSFDRTTKEETLWNVWNNMDGKYSYAMSATFSFANPVPNGRLDVEVFLHTPGFDETSLHNVGLDSGFDYFRAYHDVYQIK